MQDRSGMKFSNLQIVAAGYAAVILAGTLLLLLPISAREGMTTPLQALFTSVSASCVTGLALVDTAVHWSIFGQMVILCLIQIGGLGFMTISLRLLLLLRRRVRLRYREVMVESINSTQIGGVLRLTKEIVAGTFFFELAGAVLLAFRFVPEFGWEKGLFYSVFHAVSAFCNAGFDLMGEKEAFSSWGRTRQSDSNGIDRNWRAGFSGLGGSAPQQAPLEKVSPANENRVVHDGNFAAGRYGGNAASGAE